MKLGAVAVFAALFSGANAWHQGAIGWRPGGVPCVVASGNTTKWLSWVGVLCPPDWQIQLQVSGTGQRRIYPPKPTKTSNKIAADPPSSPIPSPSSAWYSHIIAWLTDGTTWEAATGGTAKWFIWLEELRLPSWKIQRQELATGQHSRLHVAAKANMTLAVEPPVTFLDASDGPLSDGLREKIVAAAGDEFLARIIAVLSPDDGRPNDAEKSSSHRDSDSNEAGHSSNDDSDDDRPTPTTSAQPATPPAGAQPTTRPVIAGAARSSHTGDVQSTACPKAVAQPIAPPTGGSKASDTVVHKQSASDTGRTARNRADMSNDDDSAFATPVVTAQSEEPVSSTGTDKPDNVTDDPPPNCSIVDVKNSRYQGVATKSKDPVGADAGKVAMAADSAGNNRLVKTNVRLLSFPPGSIVLDLNGNDFPPSQVAKPEVPATSIDDTAKEPVRPIDDTAKKRIYLNARRNFDIISLPRPIRPSPVSRAITSEKGKAPKTIERKPSATSSSYWCEQRESGIDSDESDDDCPYTKRATMGEVLNMYNTLTARQQERFAIKARCGYSASRTKSDGEGTEGGAPSYMDAVWDLYDRFISLSPYNSSLVLRQINEWQRSESTTKAPVAGALRIGAPRDNMSSGGTHGSGLSPNDNVEICAVLRLYDLMTASDQRTFTALALSGDELPSTTSTDPGEANMYKALSLYYRLADQDRGIFFSSALDESRQAPPPASEPKAPPSSDWRATTRLPTGNDVSVCNVLALYDRMDAEKQRVFFELALTGIQSTPTAPNDRNKPSISNGLYLYNRLSPDECSIFADLALDVDRVRPKAPRVKPVEVEPAVVVAPAAPTELPVDEETDRAARGSRASDSHSSYINS
ncbi:hypothetical protein IWW37_000123 [Coemansia sp. RSA 2050]|nr:hypothetical protein IWW37_000123 [Coemansia sp. RSA 2050]